MTGLVLVSPARARAAPALRSEAVTIPPCRDSTPRMTALRPVISMEAPSF